MPAARTPAGAAPAALPSASPPPRPLSPAAAGGLDYRAAGVDIAEADRVLDRIRPLVRSTARPGVLSEVGHFGGLFRFDTAGVRRPVLVASTDGVGTKLRVAREAGRHEAPGYDLVAHCINDILVQGAEPLFFLDYLAMGRLDAAVAEGVVRGIADACREFGVALLGGETAEMPGFYPGGDYDLAGTIVGVVDEERILDGRRAAPGDVLIGAASTGLHTNGYSLARAVLFDRLGLGVGDPLPELGVSVADALLAPHRCYLPPLRPHLDDPGLHALAHITGGGITDNLPRVLPSGTAAEVDLGSFRLPPLCRLLADAGRIAEPEMLRTFNCGIGLIAVAAPSAADTLTEALPGAFRLGEVRAAPGKPVVRYRGRLE